MKAVKVLQEAVLDSPKQPALAVQYLSSHRALAHLHRSSAPEALSPWCRPLEVRLFVKQALVSPVLYHLLASPRFSPPHQTSSQPLQAPMPSPRLDPRAGCHPGASTSDPLESWCQAKSVSPDPMWPGIAVAAEVSSASRLQEGEVAVVGALRRRPVFEVMCWLLLVMHVGDAMERKWRVAEWLGAPLGTAFRFLRCMLPTGMYYDRFIIASADGVMKAK